MIEMEERKKRNPAYEKKISEITKDDIRVALIGTVIEKDEEINSVVIDDGSGKIRIILSKELFDKLLPGQLIRVIGIVAPALEGPEFELKGEIVQDFSALDKELYAKYLKLKSL